MPHREIEVLIAEDEDLDRFLLESAFKKKQVTNPIRFFENGRELISFLKENVSDSLHDKFIVLTDLNMPIMNGFELLAELRSDPLMRRIPVFVLTSSSDETDIKRASELGIAGYISKENAGEDFMQGIELIGKWITICSVPEL
ncbi:MULTISPECIES: response regulator [Donghicola]|jgi:CheY-like chemotaxis protein|uniref:response regulator n=1 Tax=Donghicola TaxID=393277 RepID=UPI0008E3F1FB|nr:MULTISPECIES: response regulator [Donghicola]MCT4578761.1 response regulator [Donghicola sp.]SFQ79619.1 Response regulator receiver domain-containing protein [Donghicola eburneus]